MQISVRARTIIGAAIPLSSMVWMMTNCGKQSNSQTAESEAAKPQFSCTQAVPGQGSVNLSINVFETKMDVLRSSPTAKFAQLNYAITKNDNLDVPFGEPQFKCTGFSAADNNYTLSIRVFDESLIILQSSDNARFAPLKYNIKLDNPAQSRVFSRDQRPVDGALTELSLVPNGALYDAILRTVIVNRQTGEEGESKDTLGSRLDCTFTAEKINCQRDDRPVDGISTTVELTKEDGKWKATLSTALFDRSTGQEVKESKTIAELLTEAK